MTVTFNVTGDGDGGGGVNGGGGGGGETVNNGGRRVLVAKTDSLNNVVNNNNNGPVAAATVPNKASFLSVRRVLFGPPADPAETRAWLDRQMYVATAADSRLWNFDFVNERPLPDSSADRYLWERVLPPPPPLPQQQQQQQPKPRRDVVGKTAATKTVTEQEDWRAMAAEKQKQTKVTDFMGKTKKRPLSVVVTTTTTSAAVNSKNAGDEQQLSANNNNNNNNNCKRTRRSVAAAAAAAAAMMAI